MLLTTVTFNAECPCWGNDFDYNFMFLRCMENHINDAIRARGYIYLNEIYERLGVAWNPKDENKCIVFESPDRAPFIEFEVASRMPDETLVVHIHLYD